MVASIVGGVAVRRLIGAVIIVATVALSGCGGGGDDLTIEQQMSKLSGRSLSTAEVEEQLALADLMCGFDSRVLTEIWIRLDARELEFQDYVFGQHCPDRLSVYADVRPNTGTVDPDLDGADLDTDDPAVTPDEATDLLDSITGTDDKADSTSTSTTSRPATSTTSSTTRSTTTSTG